MRPMLERLDLRRRARAAGIHLLISAAVATFAATLVFGLWYPGFYRSAAGGTDLFLLVTGVDVVLGPLLTFAVFNLKKGWLHLRRDLAIVGLIQATALAYGLHTVFIVRPVALAFEVDRFRIVTAASVYLPELPKAPVPYRKLPLTGPWLLGTRTLESGDERKEAIFMALNGVDLADRPQYWQPYSDSVPEVLAKSRPLSALLNHDAARAPKFRDALSQMNVEVATARFMPLVGRTDWVIVLDARGTVCGHLKADGFF